MSTDYYILPRIGTGQPADPIRPKYGEEVDAIVDPTGAIGVARQLNIDDPDLANIASGGEGTFVFIDLSGPARAFLNSRPDSVVMGQSVVAARNQLIVRGQTNAKAQGMIQSVGGTIPGIDKALTIRTRPINPLRGTDITTWDDPDTTLWTALSANPLTKVHLSGTDGRTTFDVLSNEGQGVSDGGGAFYETVDLFHQTADNAEDSTVKLHHIDGPMPTGASEDIQVATRIIVGDTDTFYCFENQAQGGNDTRAFRVVNGVFTEIGSNVDPAINVGRFLQIEVTTNGTGVDIDITFWPDGEPDPGVPALSLTDATPGVLANASGFGGLIFLGERGSPDEVVDNLEFTNNDPPPPSVTSGPTFGSAISRATSGEPVFGARQENVG